MVNSIFCSKCTGSLLIKDTCRLDNSTTGFNVKSSQVIYTDWGKIQAWTINSWLHSAIPTSPMDEFTIVFLLWTWLSFLDIVGGTGNSFVKKLIIGAIILTSRSKTFCPTLPLMSTLLEHQLAYSLPFFMHLWVNFVWTSHGWGKTSQFRRWGYCLASAC